MNLTATRLAIACLVLVVVSTSCTSTIYNVVDSPLATATGKEPSLDQVTKAIVEAGQSLKWSMAVVQPGLIVGTLNVRSHLAVVTIKYNTKTYSINYKDSSNLKYDPNNQTIHSNYNGWIQNLDSAIRAKLSAVGA